MTVPANPENIGIHQLNLSYSTEQDRLLFRVGLHDNSELQVWLTQRIARQLWQLLSGKTHLPTAKSIQPEALPQQALEQFEQEAKAVDTLQKMDFKTEYQPRNNVKNNGAMLAIQIALTNADTATPTLHLTCLEGLVVNLNLNQEMILAICNMLQLTCKDSAWDLSTATPSMQVVTESKEEKVLH